jgi:SAM-dependent methyltransferase
MVVARSGTTRAIKNVFDLYFDIRHGTKTYGIVQLESLKIDSERRDEGQFYVATPQYEFNHIIAKIHIGPADYTLIDQGCGMGRVFLYAAEAGFGHAIGVEFSPELAAIDRKNVQLCHRSRDKEVEIEVVTGDAGDFVVPNRPCVIYFFNPFSAAVAASCLARIKESYEAGNRDMYIIWYNVTSNAEPLFRADWLQLLHHGGGRLARSPFLSASNFRLPYAIFGPSGSSRGAGALH